MTKFLYAIGRISKTLNNKNYKLCCTLFISSDLSAVFSRAAITTITKTCSTNSLMESKYNIISIDDVTYEDIRKMTHDEYWEYLFARWQYDREQVC